MLLAEMKEQKRSKCKAKVFRISASQTGKIMGGEIELTPTQEKRIVEIRKRREDFKKGVAKVKDLGKTLWNELGGYLLKAEFPTIPQGLKTHVEEKHKGKLYDSRKEFTSKMTNKGNRTEDEGISIIGKFFGYEFAKKNTKRYYNEWAHGEPDLLLLNEVIDLKSSYDEYSFPLYKDVYDSLYYYQLQTYMWLTGRKKAKLIFLLVNADEKTLLDLTRQAMYQDKNFDKSHEEVFEEMVKRYGSFEDQPMHLRMRVYEFDYSQKVIDKIKSRVLLCREYWKELDRKVEENRIRIQKLKATTQ